MTNIIIDQINESIAVKQRVAETLVEPIWRASELCIESLKNGGKLMFCGNGGSAADSQHLAAEFVVRLRGHFDRPAIPAMALTVDTSILTAGGNDYGFKNIFARQVEAFGKEPDILFAISTSGNSENVIEAVNVAGQKNVKTIGFLGASGGTLAGLVDHPVIIPSESTARIQESHILIGHIICQLCEEALFS